MNKLIVIAGPTAVGKSELSVALAKRINGEIISADSMQVYKGMDIGSAKITKEEMEGIPHFLIDELDPSEEFNVPKFTEIASRYAKEINDRGHIPIVTGGTGFYIRALLYGTDFSESSGNNDELRAKFEKDAGDHGADYLYEKLMQVDPESCKSIHKNNIKRVIRALEFYEETGRPISEHNSAQKENPPAYDFCFFVINDKRDRLYEKIDKRVDMMLDKGLLDEIKRLKARGFDSHMVSMQGIGYKELLEYLSGNISFEEAVYRIKLNSRHYAKRQITWFKREKDAIWIERPAFKSQDEILDFMIKEIKNRGLI